MTRKHRPTPVAKSTRAERAAWHPHDFGKPNDYPQIGVDIAAKEGPNGFPVPQWETRLQAYGPHGFRHETKCPHCRKWLSYRVCAPCSSMIRLIGAFEQDCRCRMDSLYIYGKCEDHKMYEDPLRVPGGS